MSKRKRKGKVANSGVKTTNTISGKYYNEQPLFGDNNIKENVIPKVINRYSNQGSRDRILRSYYGGEPTETEKLEFENVFVSKPLSYRDNLFLKELLDDASMMHKQSQPVVKYNVVNELDRVKALYDSLNDEGKTYLYSYAIDNKIIPDNRHIDVNQLYQKMRKKFAEIGLDKDLEREIGIDYKAGGDVYTEEALERGATNNFEELDKVYNVRFGKYPHIYEMISDLLKTGSTKLGSVDDSGEVRDVLLENRHIDIHSHPKLNTLNSLFPSASDRSFSQYNLEPVRKFLVFGNNKRRMYYGNNPSEDVTIPETYPSNFRRRAKRIE